MYTLGRNIIWLSLMLVLAGGISSGTAFAADVIYVDVDANDLGLGDGSSWYDAYKYLDEALDALDPCLPPDRQVWVATGTYDSDNATASFDLVNGVDVYGGFAGDEDPNFDLDDRDFSTNKTELSGIKRNSGENIAVVWADSLINAPVLDGFTITGGTVTGLYCANMDQTIRNCIIQGENTRDYGLYCFASTPFINVVIEDCTIFENTKDGIWGNNNSKINVSNCSISYNGEYGLNFAAAFTIKNSIIHHNTLGGLTGPAQDTTIINNFIYDNTGNGIHFIKPNNPNIFRNNTIVYNGGVGIENDVTGGLTAVSNCIVWENGDTTFANQVQGNFTAVYSCIENWVGDPNISHNIADDPNFVDPDNFDFHLSVDSPCVDAGVTDPNSYIEGELDIDGEVRVYNGRIDIGADEYVSYVYVPVVDKSTDINGDGIVDHQDFALLAAAWQSLQGEGTWNADCDINNDSVINVSDLQEVATDWLDITGDLDGDGFVNYVDFGMFSSAWSSQDGDPNYNTDYDFNGDGYIDLTDLLFLLKENGWL